MKPCNIPHCWRAHYAKGLCQRHYMNWWHGNPPYRQIPVTPRTRTTYSRGGKGV